MTNPAAQREEATISVLVPAAGCGARAALNGNKILAPVHGHPLLWWTLRALAAQRTFQNTDLQNASPQDQISSIDATSTDATSSTRSSSSDDAPSDASSSARIIEFVIAVRDEEREIVQQIWKQTQIELPLRLAGGGATRADSVARCVEAARGDFVLVHDAARPCLNAQVTQRVVERALRCGAAIAALPVNDTVKVVHHNDEIAQTLDRSTIYLAQTPQVFQRDWLLEALRQAHQSGFVGTDCASYVERWLHHNAQLPASSSTRSVAVVRGEENNFKVTYAADLERAMSLLHLTDL